MTLKVLLAFLLILVTPSYVSADPVPTEDSLSRSIFRAKTGPRGDMRWVECRRTLRGAAAAGRAHEYAQYLMEEYQKDPEFLPWTAAAMIAQESSFDRCAISNNHRRLIDTGFIARFGRTPVESDLVRILRSSRLRSFLGVGALDAGLAQFRWPGTEATRSGVTDPAGLLDARTSIRMLALAMKRYRGACADNDEFSGRHTTRSGRSIRYRVACSDSSWVSHNTGGGWFNYRYYYNVKSWYTRLTGPFSESGTIEVYDGRRN